MLLSEKKMLTYCHLDFSEQNTNYITNFQFNKMHFKYHICNTQTILFGTLCGDYELVIMNPRQVPGHQQLLCYPAPYLEYSNT